MRIPCLLLLFLTATLSAAPVPVIYSTDLFHPHEDPDDHFDLATLFALPELDIKAILLDQARRQLKTPGKIPLQQMFTITGRQVPYAIGLGEKLSSPADEGRNQPESVQAAVELVLKVLRESPQPVTVITAGSVRDVCAAWNRDRDLFRQQVGRLYLNIGSAQDGGWEYNVDLDPHAYCGLLRSGLPIYLCLCMPMNQPGNSNSVYSTWWHFRQSDVLESIAQPLQNYFIYALQRSAPTELDPMQALQMDLRPWHRLVWDMDRNMWCTAPFFHAAGRSVYKRNGRWTLSPAATPAQTETLFQFVPAHVEVDESGKTKKDFNPPKPNIQLFKVTAPENYGPAMRDCLRELLGGSPSK